MEVVSTGTTNQQLSPWAAVLIIIFVLLIVVGLGYYFTRDQASVSAAEWNRTPAVPSVSKPGGTGHPEARPAGPTAKETVVPGR